MRAVCCPVLQGGSIDLERRRRKKRPAVWELVTDNIYTHRKRKVRPTLARSLLIALTPTIYLVSSCWTSCLAGHYSCRAQLEPRALLQSARLHRRAFTQESASVSRPTLRAQVQDEDDIMICQCREPTFGGEGCGPNCLNYMLNIECVPVRSIMQSSVLLQLSGTPVSSHQLLAVTTVDDHGASKWSARWQGYCPSGDHCHNQMFSRRQGAKLEKVRSAPNAAQTAEDTCPQSNKQRLAPDGHT